MTPTGYEVRIQGFVQGQGVRPALARLADHHGWSGNVRNLPQGVLMNLHGTAVRELDIERLVRYSHPALTTASISVRACEVHSNGGFRIADSETNGDLAVPLPRDLAICPECLHEFHDESDRRYHYGLTSCSRCGPRLSIVESMPFDRGRTTLANFTHCNDCRSEYDSLENRRGHAQTISCPNCGPQIWAADRDGRQIASGDSACQEAAKALLQGHILALRGIGGYQLLVDARNNVAVQELRRRKRRASKPLAVLCRTLMDAESLGILDAAARRALTSPANPIVIVPRRFDSELAAGIHPQLTDIGLLLPTTAVHDRLLQLTARPLVCTSGNTEGTPLAVSVDEATEQLTGVAGLWLHHDRPIARPLDDSVVRPMAGRVVTLRCARGLAPLPLELPKASPLMALGGFQKSAHAWSNGSQSVLGPHIGDLTDLATRERWVSALADASRLYGLADVAWAVDGHPDDVARRVIPEGAQPLTIWHHHAHIVAGMLEHGWLDRSVLGIAADGQGFGPDGELWGGEALYSTATSFHRVARVRPFALVGGELAPREPFRIVAALLSQLPGFDAAQICEWTDEDPSRSRTLLQGTRAAITPWTSSLGRLFDGIAALVLGIRHASYLGEPAVRWEGICDPTATGSYSWTLHTDREPWALDWRPMLAAVLRDLRCETPPGIIAERFHRGIVDWILELHRRCPPCPLVVSGGVFQNRRLCELLAELWPADGQPLGLPGRIPPNDGGLAAGQLAIAAIGLWHGPAAVEG